MITEKYSEKVAIIFFTSTLLQRKNDASFVENSQTKEQRRLNVQSCTQLLEGN